MSGVRSIVSRCVVLVRAPFLIVGRIALVRRADLLAIIDDLIDLAAFGREFGLWERKAVLAVRPVVLQVLIGRLLQILGLWFKALPSDQYMTLLGVVGQTLFRLGVVLFDLFWTGVPAVRAGLALSVSLTDLIRRAQFGTRVLPWPGAALLTEETLRTVSMAVAMDTDFIPFALTFDAFTAFALETV